MLRLQPVAMLAVALSTLLLATGCGGRQPDSTEGTPMKTDTLVCGLVSHDLVARITGDHAISTRGQGVTPLAQRKLQPSTCDILDADRTSTVLQISVGEVDDPAHWRATLDRAAQDAGKRCVRYDSDPGHGYGCTYESGLWVDGARVNVLKGDRLIYITVMKWVDATPAQRLALAEEIARDVDRNVTAYDGK